MKKLRDLNRSCDTHPRQVVTQQIDNHQIFGALLWVCTKRFRKKRIASTIIDALSGTFHGLCGNFSVLQRKKQLRRER